MNTITLDLETGPLPDMILDGIKPTFEPARNLKDPVKIAESVAAKESEWKESATLDASRSQIIAIGIRQADANTLLHGEPERELLLKAWELIRVGTATRTLVGHNVMDFDLPFMIRRSYKYSLEVPRAIRYISKYNHESVFDTMQGWALWTQERISLDKLAWHLGVGRKNGDGALFWREYLENKAKALAYLENDLWLAEQCAWKMMP